MLFWNRSEWFRPHEQPKEELTTVFTFGWLAPPSVVEFVLVLLWVSVLWVSVLLLCSSVVVFTLFSMVSPFSAVVISSDAFLIDWLSGVGHTKCLYVLKCLIMMMALSICVVGDVVDVVFSTWILFARLVSSFLCFPTADANSRFIRLRSFILSFFSLAYSTLSSSSSSSSPFFLLLLLVVCCVWISIKVTSSSVARSASTNCRGGIWMAAKEYIWLYCCAAWRKRL